MFTHPIMCGSHTNSVTSIKFCKSGEFLASASADKSCIIHNVEPEKTSLTLSGHTDGLNDVVWLHTSQHIATASDDNTIKLWDVEKQKECTSLYGHENAVFCLALHPQHNILVSGSYDESVKLWDVRCSKTCLYSIEAHADPVSSVHFSGTGNSFVSSSYDSMVRIWDMRYGQCMRTLVEPSQQQPICAVRFMPNEDYLLTSQLNNVHNLIDLRSDIPQHLTRNRHKNVTHSIFVNHFEVDGIKYLISGSEDNRACIWNMDSEHMVNHVDGVKEDGAIIALDVHNDSNTIAVGGFGSDYSVRLLSLQCDN